MDLYRAEEPLPQASALIVALDGWTDAGGGGTTAATELRVQWQAQRLGAFDSDGLFDYRDRRPSISIDRGLLGEPEWPELVLYALDRPGSAPALLLEGAEPDFQWRALCSDVVELGETSGVDRYIGLGSVPGAIPHTRPSRLIATSSDVRLADAIGRPHEQLVVPGSCQVIIESACRNAGWTTLGLWARIPHYVGGQYPEAARLLLRGLSEHLGSDLDVGALDEEIEEQRERLAVAAASSPEVQAHIAALEEAYDAEEESGDVTGGLSGPLPSGEQLAAEFERFLRNRDED